MKNNKDANYEGAAAAAVDRNNPLKGGDAFTGGEYSGEKSAK